VKIWPRYTGGEVMEQWPYMGSQETAGSIKKAWPIGTGGRLTRMPIFTGFAVIIKTQWLIQFLSVTSSVAISVKLTKLFNNREDYIDYFHAKMSTEPHRRMRNVWFLRCALLAGRLINVKLCTGWTSLVFRYSVLLHFPTFYHPWTAELSSSSVSWPQFGGTWRIG